MGFNDRTNLLGNVCLNCKERFPACHDVCGAYLRAKAEQEERKRQINEARDRYKNYDNYRTERIRQTKKHIEGRRKK